jgi:hypothetical protein
MSEEEWDKVSKSNFLYSTCTPHHVHVQRNRKKLITGFLQMQCWSANVKVPKALLSEARETFEANADGGHMITTGSIAVTLPPFPQLT